MESKWLWATSVIVILALGGWYLFSRPLTTQAPSEEGGAMTTSNEAAPAAITVTYTDQGFSPASVTVAEGQTVTWVNRSSGNMWVASGVHPTHALYDGTNANTHCAAGYAGGTPFDECAAIGAGASYSFTFTKTGDWKYHNHMSTGDTGEVIVTAASGAGVSAGAEVNVR